jgi:hypothetical protein
MSETTEYQLEAVPPGARRSGDTRSRWAWVEPLVWTERMLTALEQGVKGGKWFSLSILRRRLGLRGISRGADSFRWPNAFFAEQGLYNLSAAHALARQSSSR